eukprot:TRINITY_DN3250_c0_g1_i5.p1 TRINITY_DN3250_c0_g1~~TRINITY_DN3250_c0_g1_i5.p1  ORF type:complete len:981 (-),score=194.12 TRINITY_DN3250_c0_g1_i5:341-3283(-)
MLKLMLQPKLVGDTRVMLNSFRFKHTSSEVRSQFLEFFQAHGHKLIPSSPVLPLNDPSLLFVNAGMNQFKRVLQNEIEPPAPRVVNSQRCIRVGGKHNDLSQVGLDGSHLTMFEMLGSWSFKDYWKEEACSMAWTLLTQHYRLDPKKLYVTYFGGCEKSGLPPDLEVRDTWLNIGVDPSHILPFGMKDNFWEMGSSGPCGPCTEIHYDYNDKGPDLVNAGTSENIEIWNLVFVEYNRFLNGELEKLGGRHIDTGMGLERLVAVLNNSNSSFDSDLFQPLFEAISIHSGAPKYGGNFDANAELDTAYRILADHMRMIVVCLGDQVFPDQNHKLKYVLRKAFNIANNTFKAPHGLVQELSNHVIESLGDTFPVLQTRQHIIKSILEFEEEGYKKFTDKSEKNYHQIKKEFPKEAEYIDANEATNFLDAIRLLEKEKVLDKLEPGLAFKLYESHGMQEQDIAKLSQIRNIQFNQDEFTQYFERKKMESKIGTSQAKDFEEILAQSDSLPSTQDSAKYVYSRDEESGLYEFPTTQANVLRIVSDGQVVQQINEGDEAIVFLDSTCFYGEAGGQVGDKGTISVGETLFQVVNTQLVSDRLVAHMGSVKQGTLCAGDNVQAEIDPYHRVRCMQNHTGTHVLNTVLHQLLPITAQKSSLVTPDHLRFEFSVYNADTDVEFLRRVEDGVLRIIEEGCEVQRRVVDGGDALQKVDRLVTLPGEVYPEQNISLITISDQQTEPCCGTHLLNTAHLKHFVIVGAKTASTGVKMLRCLTGDAARLSRENGVRLCEEILSYQGTLEGNCEDLDKKMVDKVSQKISHWKSSISDANFPTILHHELSQVLETYRQKIVFSQRADLKKEVSAQFQAAMDEQQSRPYLMVIINVDKGKIDLNKLCKMASKPALILAIDKGSVKAKAMMSKEMVTDDFNAETWLQPIVDHFKGTAKAPKGQDKRVNCILGATKVTKDNLDDLESVFERADAMASEYFK